MTLKKIVLIIVSLLFANICFAENWNEYYKDSNTKYSYRDISMIDKEIKEVSYLQETGDASVMNSYKINCKTKEYSIIYSDVNIIKSYRKPGDGKWYALDKTSPLYKAQSKLIDIVCIKRISGDY